MKKRVVCQKLTNSQDCCLCTLLLICQKCGQIIPFIATKTNGPNQLVLLFINHRCPEYLLKNDEAKVDELAQ